MSEFNIGDRVIAMHELTDPACGDHPELLYAKKGDSLIIHAIEEWGDIDIRVSHEDDDDYFYVNASDIKKDWEA
jgi:hypothetical protein